MSGFLGPYQVTPQERRALNERETFYKQEVAYGAIQGTKPQTLAYGLQDSPVGLLAWMLEKYWAWTDHGDQLWDTLHQNTVLTTVTLYWLTKHVYSAARIYYENSQWGGSTLPPGNVPRLEVLYPKDPFSVRLLTLASLPSSDLVRYSAQSKGGHHPGLEVPDLWATDVATFFSGLPPQTK